MLHKKMIIRGFTLIRRLGKGTCGEVWQARAKGGIKVALKFIRWSASDMLAQRELRALGAIKSLRHAFLVSIHEYFLDGGWLVIVMDLADCSLRELDTTYREAGKGGIPLTDLLRYCADTAEAVDYLNSRDVIHRDVKPENIFLVGLHAKLGDCGMARFQLREWQGKASHAGTLDYLPAEALDGKPTGRSDQYSLAMTYFELRVGRLAFSCTTLQESMQAIRYQLPNLAPLDGAELKVLEKALAKDQDRRYLSCVEFVTALERATLAAAAVGAP